MQVNDKVSLFWERESARATERERARASESRQRKRRVLDARRLRVPLNQSMPYYYLNLLSESRQRQRRVFGPILLKYAFNTATVVSGSRQY